MPGLSQSDSHLDPGPVTPRISAEETLNYFNARIAHAVVGCVTFAVILPLGAVMLRVLQEPRNVTFHVGCQLAGLLSGVATMALGLYMALVSYQLSTTHAVVGLCTVCCLALQPLTGSLHHRKFKLSSKRSPLTYAHIFCSMAIITLGIVNGGLGLHLSHDDSWVPVTYGIVVALMWTAWMQVSLLALARKRWDDEPVSTNAGFGKRSRISSRNVSGVPATVEAEWNRPRESKRLSAAPRRWTPSRIEKVRWPFLTSQSTRSSSPQTNVMSWASSGEMPTRDRSPVGSQLTAQVELSCV